MTLSCSRALANAVTQVAEVNVRCWSWTTTPASTCPRCSLTLHRAAGFGRVHRPYAAWRHDRRRPAGARWVEERRPPGSALQQRIDSYHSKAQCPMAPISLVPAVPGMKHRATSAIHPDYQRAMASCDPRRVG
jgi:hypothetical protein